jgi:tRNA(fMet)-specific endonuclease VapC
MYLLDTNACIGVLNNSADPLVARLQQHSPNEIYLSAVVKAELIYGAYHSQNVAANLRVLAQFFAPFSSLPFDDLCLDHYGRIRSELARAGTSIGPYDLMIAATAVSHNLTLVTHNIQEFSRAAGLKFEDWELV